MCSTKPVMQKAAQSINTEYVHILYYRYRICIYSIYSVYRICTYCTHIETLAK